MSTTNNPYEFPGAGPVNTEAFYAALAEFKASVEKTRDEFIPKADAAIAITASLVTTLEQILDLVARFLPAADVTPITGATEEAKKCTTSLCQLRDSLPSILSMVGSLRL